MWCGVVWCGVVWPQARRITIKYYILLEEGVYSNSALMDIRDSQLQGGAPVRKGALIGGWLNRIIL